MLLLDPKKMFVLLLMSAIHDVFKEINNYYAVYNSAIFLGPHPDPSTDIKNKLSNKIFSKNSIYNALYSSTDTTQNTIKCDTTEIKSNSLAVYFATSIDISGQLKSQLCGLTEDASSTINGIISAIKLPYIYKTIHGNQLNLELYTSYSKILITQTALLPYGSTLITISSAQYPSSNGILDEILFQSSFSYSNNPYIKYVYYILINPDESTFALNLISGVIFFNIDPNQIIDFSEEAIKSWQKNKIKKFIDFFNELYIHHYTNIEAEFKRFTEQFSNLDSSEFKWISLTQNDSLYRYKELLFINYILKGYTTKALTLLDYNVSIKASLSNGITSLFISAYQGNLNFTKLCIQKGVDIEAKQSNGATPLLAATSNMHYNIVKLLLENNANINACDTNGNNALMYSFKKGCSSVVDLLIEFQIDINHQNKKGVTPLILASILGHTEIVKKLLNSGANSEVLLNNLVALSELLVFLKPNGIIYDTNCNNTSILCYANLNELLIDISSRNKEGATALILASALGHLEVIKELLDVSANINNINNDTYSALTIAINQHKFHAVKLLLSYAPNLKSPDYIAYKQNHDYDNEINHEIEKFKINPINYVLENNNNITKIIKALDNLKIYVNIEYISKIQICLRELESDKLYSNLLEICSNNIEKQNYLMDSDYTINISFLGLSENATL